MKRSELKEVVKDLVRECLTEVLLEGLGRPKVVESISSRPAVKSQASSPRPTHQVEQSKPRSTSVLDLIRVSGQPGVQRPIIHQGPQSNVVSRVPPVTKSASPADVMADIFADTAKTTLVEQVAADRKGGVAAGPETGIDPMKIFAESSMNWEALAFSDKPAERSVAG